MKNKSTSCLWIAFKIWIIAILLNTVIGTLVISSRGFEFGIAVIGGYYAIIFSWPVLIVLTLVINLLVKRQVKHETLFLIITIISLALAVLDLLVFFNSFGRLNDQTFSLYVVGSSSAIGAVASQYNSFRRLARYPDPLKDLITDQEEMASSI